MQGYLSHFHILGYTKALAYNHFKHLLNLEGLYILRSCLITLGVRWGLNQIPGLPKPRILTHDQFATK